MCTVAPVTPAGKQRRPRAGLTAGGAFVVQLRSDSDVPGRRLRGRVEHVKSGRSEQFASLDRLLAFMARYSDAAGATGDEEDTDATR